MRDYNYPLTKDYKSKLTGILNTAGNEVPVYYQEAPDDVSVDEYIVINNTGANPGGTKSSDDTTVLISITVHTQKVKYNNGVECDHIINEVLKKLPRKMFDNGYDYSNGIQDVNMKMVDDKPLTMNFGGAKKFVNRILIFEHQLFFFTPVVEEAEEGFHINGNIFAINGSVFTVNS